MSCDGDEVTYTRHELRESTLRGLRWVTLARVASEAAAVTAMIALARLVSPTEFGHAAVALVVSALAILVAGAGFGTPLVQRQTITRAHLESAALCSVLTGLGLSGLTWLAAMTVLPSLFGEKSSELIGLMAPVFALTALGVVGQATLQRRLDFRRLSLFEMAGMTFGAATSVGLALLGLGAHAIVLGSLAAATTSSLLLLTVRPLARPRWDRQAAAEIARFGVPAALSSLANIGYRNIDYAILTAKLAPAQVGFYWRAFQLGVEYQRKVSSVMMRMALPVFSRSVDVEHLRALRHRIVRVHGVVIFPILTYFAIVAPVLVPWVLGSRWEPAVVPAQILVIAGMSSAVITGLGPLMFAVGRPDALLKYNLVSLACFGVTVFLVAPAGIVAVAAAAAGFSVLQLLAAQRFLLERLVGIPMRSLVADVAPAFVSSAAMLAAVAPLRAALDGAGVEPVPLLIAAGAVAAAVYVTLLRLLFAAAFADAALLVRRVLTRSPPTRRAGVTVGEAAARAG